MIFVVVQIPYFWEGLFNIPVQEITAPPYEQEDFGNYLIKEKKQ